MKTNHLSTVAQRNEDEWAMRLWRMWEGLDRVSRWTPWPPPCSRMTATNIRLPPDTLNHPHPRSCPLGSAWVKLRRSLFWDAKSTRWCTPTCFCIEPHHNRLHGIIHWSALKHGKGEEISQDVLDILWDGCDRCCLHWMNIVCAKGGQIEFEGLMGKNKETFLKQSFVLSSHLVVCAKP